MAETVKGLVIKIDGDVSGLRGALGTVSKEANSLSKDLGKIGKKVTAFGSTMTRNVTLPIVAGFAASAKSAMSFEDAMAKVAAVSGATGDDFDTLSARAREMGEITLHSATDVADAMYYMGLAGWDTTQIYNGIPGVLDLATASGEDLASVSDIVTDAMTAFGLGAEKTTHFVDVLAQATRNSNTDISGLGEAFKYVAPVAGALNYSIEDVAHALGLMANQGIKGSQGGTALRNILQRLAKPTEEVSNAMNYLNISLLNENGTAKTLSEIMGDMRVAFGDLLKPSEELQFQIDTLNSAMESGDILEEEYIDKLAAIADAAYGAGTAEKVRYAATLAGARGMPGLLAIVNTAEEDYNGLADAIYSADGATREMSALMEGTTTGQFKILISQITELGIQIGQMLLPYIQSGIEKISSVVSWLTDLDEEQRKTILTIAAVVAAIGPVILIVGKAISAISMVAQAIGFLTSPVGLVIVAIGALIAIFVHLWNTSEEFRDAIKKIWDSIHETFSGTIQNIKELVTGLWNSIKQVLTGIVQFVSGVFTLDWSMAWEGIKNIFTGLLTGMFESGKAIFNNMVTFVKGIVEKLKNAFNFEWKLPKLKLPHISISKKKGLFGLEYPSFSVSWYRKAYDNPYLFTSPTVVNGKGFGDGNGGEIVYGRDQLMRDIAQASTGDITINVYANEGMNVNQLADKISQRLAQVQKQRISAYA